MTMNRTIHLLCAAAGIALALAPVRSARATLTVDAPGYEAKAITLTTSGVLSEGPALAADPANPWLYAPVDLTGGVWQGYNDHTVWRLDFSSDPPTTSVFSLGAYRTTLVSGPGDNVLDSVFGSVGGLAVLSDGSLLITDNYVDSQGRGDTIYRARDLNGDGDARDVVDVGGVPTSETLVLIAPIATPPGSGLGGFSGVQAEMGPDGTAYVITSDGAGQGEILAIDDPTSATPSIHVFFSGLDFGSGLAFDSAGRLYAGNVNLNFSDFTSTVTIYRLDDANHDGVIMGVEAQVVSYDQLAGLYDIAVSPEDGVFVTSANEVRIVNPADGTSTLFAHDPDFTFLSDLTFLNRTGGFAPFTGPNAATLIVADPNSDGKFTAIMPSAPPPAGVRGWEMYQ